MKTCTKREMVSDLLKNLDLSLDHDPGAVASGYELTDGNSYDVAEAFLNEYDCLAYSQDGSGGDCDCPTGWHRKHSCCG